VSPGGKRYTSIYNCASTIYRTEGVAAFYKGLAATLLCGVPYVAMQMTFYSHFKESFANSHNRRVAAADGHVATTTTTKVVAAAALQTATLVTASTLPTWAMLMCGSSAGLVSQTISFPFDVVRHRMQSNGLNGAPEKYSGTFDCFRQMFKTEGPRSFYRGWAVNAMRCLPGAAIQFTSYDLLKRLLDAE
jgi:solute carrier family 25 protein 16